MSTNSVYLAGAITGCTLDGANDWRQRAAEYLRQQGITVYDPLRGKEFLHSLVGVGVYGQQYAGHPLSTAHGITSRDRWDVYRCDLLFVNLLDGATETLYQAHTQEVPRATWYEKVQREIVSIGTVMEIAWADAWRKYILVVMPEQTIYDHGMLTTAASLVLHDFEQALHLVPVILGG